MKTAAPKRPVERPGAAAALFNPRTRDAIRLRTGRDLRLILAGAAVVVGAMLGGAHYEEPLLPYLLGLCAPDVARGDCAYDHWLDVAAGLAATALFGAFFFVVYRLRPLRPTVSCRRCDGAGWIEDLRNSAGRCPRCSHDRFRYRAREIVPDPNTMSGRNVLIQTWALDDVAGAELLALKAEKGNNLN
jgi:hypothetical protein